MNDRGQIVLRYCTPDGRLTNAANPNGSLGHIAGIVSEGGNVFGLMPHPERAAEPAVGGTDGLLLLRALADRLAAPAR
jgi:phosphoribosylformylglycinamidine (FGAM) synthase-like amidotransferase family enzyme